MVHAEVHANLNGGTGDDRQCSGGHLCEVCIGSPSIGAGFSFLMLKQSLLTLSELCGHL